MQLVDTGTGHDLTVVCVGASDMFLSSCEAFACTDCHWTASSEEGVAARPAQSGRGSVAYVTNGLLACRVFSHAALLAIRLVLQVDK